MKPTPRALVLCADDYACDAAVSSGVRQLVQAGALSATSAMVLAPRWPEEAAALQSWRGQVDVGLHLDFTSNFAVQAGHGLPLGAAMRRAWLGSWARSPVRQVIERQLDAFEQAWQAPPDHLDGHQHVQQFRGIREPLLDLLRQRYGAQAPWLRVSQVPAAQRDIKSWVIARMGAKALRAQAQAAHVPCATWLSGVYDFRGGRARYMGLMGAWLAQAPAGTVLMCHPAAAQPAGAPDDAIGPARVWEFEHLISPAFAAQRQAAGVRLVRGRDLYTAAA